MIMFCSGQPGHFHHHEREAGVVRQHERNVQHFPAVHPDGIGQLPASKLIKI